MALLLGKWMSWAVICASLLLSGCITSGMYESSKPHSYQELVDAVLISRDGDKMVVMADSYHYVFDTPQMLSKTFNADFYSQVRAEFTDFEVSGWGDLSGSFLLVLPQDASTAAQAEAAVLGYERAGDGRMSYRDQVRGKRYAANGIKPEGELYAHQLNTRYTIYVTERPNTVKSVGRVLVTPITVTADGLLILAAAPLLPFVIGGLLLSPPEWRH